jgi:hypothetical protein
MLRLRLLAAFNLALLSACPSDDPPKAEHEPRPRSDVPSAPTHSGLISIQDVSIANLPQAGHGLTVQSFFLPLRAPDYEDKPGSLFGCEVSAYDASRGGLPRETDQGKLRIDGIAGGSISCGFAAGRGYVCPTASGSASVEVVSGDGGGRRAVLASVWGESGA